MDCDRSQLKLLAVVSELHAARYSTTLARLCGPGWTATVGRVRCEGEGYPICASSSCETVAVAMAADDGFFVIDLLNEKRPVKKVTSIGAATKLADTLSLESATALLTALRDAERRAKQPAAEAEDVEAKRD